jgi:hypothetical protein
MKIRAQGRTIATFGAEKAGQEHHAAFEHNSPWDGTILDGGGGYDRRGLLRACRVPPGGSPTVKRAVLTVARLASYGCPVW